MEKTLSHLSKRQVGTSQTMFSYLKEIIFGTKKGFLLFAIRATSFMRRGLARIKSWLVLKMAKLLSKQEKS